VCRGRRPNKEFRAKVEAVRPETAAELGGLGGAHENEDENWGAGGASFGLGTKKLSPVFRSKGLRFCYEGCLASLVELRRRRCPGFDGDADFHEKLFLPGWRAHAQHPCRLPALVLELVWRIRWNVDGFTGSRDRLFAAKGNLYFALKDGEHLFEIMAMHGRTATWRDVRVDEAVAPGGVFARDKDRIGVSHHSDVREVRAI
jgi:hypothetical protein